MLGGILGCDLIGAGYVYTRKVSTGRNHCSRNCNRCRSPIANAAAVVLWCVHGELLQIPLMVESD